MNALIEHAYHAAEHAYAPYSHFRVGAAIRLQDGTIVTGANVENISFGLTICAERAALVRAIAEYGPAIRIHAIAVVNLNAAASPPCGACRQMLAEFTEPDAQVVFPAASGRCTLAFKDVLPFGFDMTLKPSVVKS